MYHYLTIFIFATVSCQEFVPDYKLALKYSILYYEAQRSGKLPENNRIKWRGDSALEDKGENGEDLSGGYYDGSDFVKFSYPMAYSISMLSWGVILYPEVYKSIGEYEAVVDVIKWATDYFIKCHVSPNELYGQVGNFKLDHKFWGRPEDLNMTRSAYKINETHPGSDLAAEVSAVFSSASIIFGDINQMYAEDLLNHSLELYNFAKNFRGLSKDIIPGAKQYYEIHSYGDQLTWAALWLYKATNNSEYLQDAESWFEEFNLESNISTYFYFNDHIVGIRLLLGQLTEKNAYIRPVKEFCDNSIDIPKTPKGLIFIRKIGTLALAANNAFLCLEAAKFPGFPKEKYIDFSRTQVDYILGSTGQSFVVGFGDKYPKKPYHSASSCPDMPAPCGWDEYNSTDPNPQIVYGALVSGPNETDHYIDRREDFHFEYNLVGMDYNAGFQNALAALIDLERREPQNYGREISLRVLPLRSGFNFR